MRAKKIVIFVVDDNIIIINVKAAVTTKASSKTFPTANTDDKAAGDTIYAVRAAYKKGN